jgi:hypothetical protein
MWKQLVGVLMVAGTLVGCGAPAVAPLASLPAPRALATSARIVLTSGSQVLNSPKDSLPIRMTITVTGTKGGQPFKAVVKTFDPSYFYVPTAQSAIVNGNTVPASGWTALSEDLWQASKTTPSAESFSTLASATLRFSVPRNGVPVANDGIAGTAKPQGRLPALGSRTLRRLPVHQALSESWGLLHWPLTVNRLRYADWQAGQTDLPFNCSSGSTGPPLSWRTREKDRRPPPRRLHRLGP